MFVLGNSLPLILSFDDYGIVITSSSSFSSFFMHNRFLSIHIVLHSVSLGRTETSTLSTQSMSCFSNLHHMFLFTHSFGQPFGEGAVEAARPDKWTILESTFLSYMKYLDFWTQACETFSRVRENNASRCQRSHEQTYRWTACSSCAFQKRNQQVNQNSINLFDPTQNLVSQCHDSPVCRTPLLGENT